MFISREKFDALQAAHDTLKAERDKVTAALALSAEATTDDVLKAISEASNSGEDAAQKQKTAEDALAKVTTSLDDLGASVKEAKDPEAKVEAVRALLAAKPGTLSTEVKTEKDKIKTVKGIDQETIDSLPHNKEFDKNNLIQD